MEKQASIEELYLSPRRPERQAPQVSSALLALVREFGPVLPVIVRKSAHARYEILSNAETWLAAQRTGHHQLPIVIRRGISDEQADALLRLKSTENPLQRAQRYASWLEALPANQRHGAISDLARRQGCSRSHLAHLLRLLNLPELIQQAIAEGMLNLGQAKALAGVDNRDEQLRIATEAIRSRWTVRQTEKAAREGLQAGQGRAVPDQDFHTRQVERRLSEHLGSPVSVDLRKGHLTIDFRKDLGVLNGLLEHLGYRDE